jgi:c-di-GMP-binding flagellar brake protein YcgR
MELDKNKMTRTERRRFPRLNASVSVDYSIVEKGLLKGSTSTKNISAGGICLIVYEEIKPNSTLSLKINLPDDRGFIEVKGKVVWTSEFSLGPDQKKRWDIGIEFININKEVQKRISKYVFMLLR